MFWVPVWFLHASVFSWRQFFHFHALCVCVCVRAYAYSTGYQAFGPFWFHLSGPDWVWSQSIRVLCVPVCQWVPGESHDTFEWKELHQSFSFEPGEPFCACMFCHFCVRQVDEVMLTLKQAFSTAAALQSNKTEIQLCEACPMHDLHKLCERIEGDSHPWGLVFGIIHKHIDPWGASEREWDFLFPPLFPGLYPPRAKLAIQKYLSQLTDNEQAEIFERVQVLVRSS